MAEVISENNQTKHLKVFKSKNKKLFKKNKATKYHMTGDHHIDNFENIYMKEAVLALIQSTNIQFAGGSKKGGGIGSTSGSKRGSVHHQHHKKKSNSPIKKRLSRASVVVKHKNHLDLVLVQ
jgi:hypothetical protein